MSEKEATNSHGPKPILLPLCLGILFFLVISIAWVFETPTKEELGGGVGKIWDLLKTPMSGWCPNYMMGVSASLYDAFAASMGLSKVANFFLAGFLGSIVSEKLLSLSFIPASAVSMWFFMRRLGADRSLSAWGSLLYVILPSFHVAVGIYEHRTVGFCFVFTPLILRGILAVAEEGSPREIVGLGLAAASLALSYTKIAIVLSPILILWSVEVLVRNRNFIPRTLIGYGFSLIVAAFTSILILIPASREFGFAASFLFDPLDAWKHHYSFKTPLLWIDLWRGLTKGGDGNLTGDAAMFWIGIVPLAALSLVLGLPSLAEWRRGAMGRWFLVLTACWLLGTWFASGPDGLLMGHINVLKSSQGLPDTSIPLLWLSMIWLGWLIYRAAEGLLSKAPFWMPALVSAVVLVVPVFRLAEFLPLFGDIRAPESFWSVGGFCCLASASGIAFWILFTEVIRESWRRPLAIAVGIAMLVELYPVYSAYWTRGLEGQLFAGFDEAAGFLRTAPVQGRVHPVGTRYFYLTLPEKSGRSLDSEAAYRHFQLKWVRHLETAGNASGDTLRNYLNLAGVAYILIDKDDPFTPKQMQDFFRSIYPVVFENRYFVVLENQNALYPAFLAHDFVDLPPNSYAMAPAVLQLLPQNLVTVEQDHADETAPGFAGMAKGTNQIGLLSSFQGKAGQPFVRVPLVGKRMDDYNRMSYQLPPAASGWMVVSEAWHPDWTVTIDGKPAQTTRAEAALLSTYIPQGSREVVFQFKAPDWYSLSLYAGVISWIIALSALFYLPSKWAPPAWKNWWIGAGKHAQG